MVSLDGRSANKVDDVTALPCRADDVIVSHIQDGGYALLWQRYDNNKMAAILHLQQYSHRLNLLFFSPHLLHILKTLPSSFLEKGKNRRGVGGCEAVVIPFCRQKLPHAQCCVGGSTVVMQKPLI